MMTATLGKPASIPELASRLCTLGYWPVPIPAGSKKPAGTEWQKLRLTPEEAATKFTNNVGIGALHVNLMAIDIDVYDPDLAATLVAEGMRRFPGALERIGQAPKSALFLRMDEPGYKVSNSEKHERVDPETGEAISAHVEVRSVTGQVVVYAKHPDTGKPYTWPRGDLWETPRENLPEANKADVERYRDWCTEQIRKWAGADGQNVINLDNYPRPGGDALTPVKMSAESFEEALGFVSASVAYDDWLEALMGIHDFYGGSEAGLSVAQSYSSSYAKYDPREVAAKWRSFKIGGGIGYKSVLNLAKQGGCDLGALARKDRAAALGQQAPEAPPAASPVSGAPKKAQSEPALTDWVFLSADNEFYNPATGERMSVTAFNLALAPITPKVEVEDSKGNPVEKKLAASKTLISFLDGIVVSNTMYRPDIGDSQFAVDGIPYINSYMPRTVPECDSEWEQKEAWQICRDHIRNILPDEADVIIQWMAHNVQHPGVKILWAPVIVGVQGDGKTTLSKMLQGAMGRRNVGPVAPETMFSDFTGWAEGSCVKVLEEIRVHGSSRHNAMDKLKPLITNDSVEVVTKGKNGKQIANVTNYMALTNHMDALALDEGDRRWGVFRTRFETRLDMLAELDSTYWERLHNAIDGNPSVIRGWLKAVPLNGFDRVAGPETNKHKMAMIEATRSPYLADTMEAIELGGFGITRDVVATDCLNGFLKTEFSKTLNGPMMFNIMGALGWVRYPRTVKWKGKNRRVYYRQEAFKLYEAKASDADFNRKFRETLDLTAPDMEAGNDF